MYTNKEQDDALEVLSDLVKENQKLKDELNLAKQFTLRMIMAKEVHKSDKAIFFFDDGVIEDQEDFYQILPHFFFDFNPNSNMNEVNGQFMSSVSLRIKDSTAFPLVGTDDQIKEKVLTVEKNIIF